MNLNTCVIYAPVDSYSGYGARSRSFCRALIELKKEEWNIKILPCKWGNLSMNYINDNIDTWGFLNEYLLFDGLRYQPDYMFFITIPNEVENIGKWNCLVTAGTEVSRGPIEWDEKVLSMGLVLTSSNHSKRSLGDHSNIEVLPEEICEDIKLEHNTSLPIYKTITKIPEDFCFLFLGSWLPGNMGHDRKNVGLLIRGFLETFKKHKNPPALILKTSIKGNSYMDNFEIKKRINAIKETLPKGDYPNIYILQGDLSSESLNSLYNHPKIKCMVNAFKGEGFGRPLLEFASLGKPVICSNWSGPQDFLCEKHHLLIKGQEGTVDISSNMGNYKSENAVWFYPEYNDLKDKMKEVFSNYSKYKKLSQKYSIKKLNNIFNYNHLKSMLDKKLNEKVPQLPILMETLNLPKI